MQPPGAAPPIWTACGSSYGRRALEPELQVIIEVIVCAWGYCAASSGNACLAGVYVLRCSLYGLIARAIARASFASYHVVYVVVRCYVSLVVAFSFSVMLSL